MESKIQVFSNKEFGDLEVLMIDDKPYFPAKECATILGYSNQRKAVIDHCREDGVTNRDAIDKLGRNQEKKAPSNPRCMKRTIAVQTTYRNPRRLLRRQPRRYTPYG